MDGGAFNNNFGNCLMFKAAMDFNHLNVTK